MVLLLPNIKLLHRTSSLGPARDFRITQDCTINHKLLIKHQLLHLSMRQTQKGNSIRIMYNSLIFLQSTSHLLQLQAKWHLQQVHRRKTMHSHKLSSDISKLDPHRHRHRHQIPLPLLQLSPRHRLRRHCQGIFMVQARQHPRQATSSLQLHQRAVP